MIIRFTLYDIYIFLIALLKGLGLDSSDKLYIIAFAIGCVAVVIKVYNEKFTVKELLAMGSLVCIGILNVLIGRTTTILFSAVAICGLKNVDINRTIRISMFARLFAFVCMVVLYGSGILENKSYMFNRNGEIIERYLLGYGHPNLAHLMFAVVVFHVLFLYHDKLGFPHFAAILFLNFMLYSITFSRTGVVMVIISTCFCAFRKWMTFRKVLLFTVRYAFIVLFFATILIAFIPENWQIYSSVNTLLTGRFYYIKQILTEELPGWFGNSSLEKKYNLDNGYIRLLYEDGILATAWLGFFFIKLTKDIYKKKMYKECCLLMSFFFYNLAEGVLSTVSLNFSLLLLGSVLFNKNEENQKWRNLQYSHPHTIEKRN